MGRSIERLKALTVERSLKKPGMYCDGGGLWLCVSSPTAASWLFRYQLQGTARAMGLGSARDISLQEARTAAAAARKCKAMGSDPLHERERIAAERRAKAVRAITFKQGAEAYIEAHRAGWRSAKHASAWTTTLAMYAYPVIGDLQISDIDVGLVQRVLEPIWNEKPESASRLRGRIESILNWATVKGYRAGDNPARWRGHLQHLLPHRSDLAPVQHLEAMPYAEVPAFMADLREQDGINARALEFAILNAARTGAVLGALWDEIDLDAGIWTVQPHRPGVKIKERDAQPRRVPLARRSLDILNALPRHKGNPYVFMGAKAGASIGEDAMRRVLQERLGHANLTTHGFRSAFKDWAAEKTNFPDGVSEAALWHAKGKLTAAYQRGDLLEKRRRLMEAWDGYCAAVPSGEVVPIRRGMMA